MSRPSPRDERGHTALGSSSPHLSESMAGSSSDEWRSRVARHEQNRASFESSLAKNYVELEALDLLASPERSSHDKAQSLTRKGPSPRQSQLGDDTAPIFDFDEQTASQPAFPHTIQETPFIEGTQFSGQGPSAPRWNNPRESFNRPRASGSSFSSPAQKRTAPEDLERAAPKSPRRSSITGDEEIVFDLQTRITRDPSHVPATAKDQVPGSPALPQRTESDEVGTARQDESSDQPAVSGSSSHLPAPVSSGTQLTIPTSSQPFFPPPTTVGDRLPLFVLDEAGQWVDLSGLNDDARQALEQRHEHLFEHKSGRYRTMHQKGNDELQHSLPSCAECQVHICQRTACNTNAAKRTACDKCVDNQTPCGMFIQHPSGAQSGYAIGHFPLPIVYRVDEPWEALGYWVRQYMPGPVKWKKLTAGQPKAKGPARVGKRPPPSDRKMRVRKG
ncbi:hypothetical protein BDV96DRAFT_654415 [Lophiotrema nucula]|uniref:Uncharacterized protein n=1 Tax=Lophiotrema nucula TaxID=690887 RepID=A0A6A5YJE0_9PLEO|nr:hypothetical protein BDV96DRAFT_654415 [Lophiotrema nucula]